MISREQVDAKRQSYRSPELYPNSQPQTERSCTLTVLQAIHSFSLLFPEGKLFLLTKRHTAAYSWGRGGHSLKAMLGDWSEYFSDTLSPIEEVSTIITTIAFVIDSCFPQVYH